MIIVLIQKKEKLFMNAISTEEKKKFALILIL